MLATAIELCKSALELVFKSKEMRSETKVRVGILLEEISKVLEDTANSLSKDVYPTFNCALMEKMCGHLHYHIKDIVPEDQLDKLYVALREASQVEKQFAIRHNPDVIPSIYEAAAEFKSLSLMMRV